MKKLLSWILVLALCLSLFPCVAMAEEAEEPVGEIAPVEEPVPPLEDEDGELSGTPAPAEEDEAGALVGDGVLGLPSDDPAALPTAPAADEIQDITASGSCGENLTWTLDNGVLTISGTGAMSNWSSESSVPWFSYREIISQIILQEGLTGIGKYAFCGCKYIAGVTIPAGVTSIGDIAFRECSSLTSVTISSSVTSIGSYAFSKCSNLRSVTIPAGVISIGSQAFYSCSSLTSVTIPSSVTSIDSSAFENCSSLTSITIPSSVTSIEHGAFSGCSKVTSVTIPSSVISIGDRAFYGCNLIRTVYIDNLEWWLGLSDSDGKALPHGDLYLNGKLVTSISVPEGILGLRPSMFKRMTSLQSATLPKSLRTVGPNAFEDCRSLTTVTIPSGVTSIGESAFYRCSGLKNVTILEGATSIGGSAFSGCSSLTSVTIPSSVTSIGGSAFSGCSSLMSVTIREGVASIGGSAFSGCSSLTAVTIPSSVTSIGSSAFDTCISLTSVTIRESVTSIKYNAFDTCISLAEIRIPASITSIEIHAFHGCNSLRRVDFLGDAPSISSSAFSGWFDADTNTDYHVRAFALYPLENETWTEEMLQNYGGTLTWIPYRDGEAGTPIAYALRFDPNGGEGGPELQYKGRGVDLTLSETEPNRDYYRFQGWAEEAEADEPSFLPGQSYGEDRELSLYAVWTPRTWELQYALNGGQGGPESQIKTYGEALTLPDTVPTREGFEFLGWSTKFGDSVPSYFPGDSFTGEGDPRGDGPITLYAVWQIKLFLVSYHSNGGEDAPPPQLKTYGRALILSTDIPRRTGYTFLGWSKSRSAAEPDYLPGDRFTENADRVLYAVWQRGDQGQPTQASLTPRDAAGCIGSEFTVDLMLEKNPGLMFLSFTLDYDDAVLEFLGAEDGALSGWTVVPAENSLVWDSDRDHTENGCVLHLRFRAKAGLEPGTVRLGVKDLFAANYNEERLQIQAGTGLIRLADRLPGDVNGDGTVDGLDLIRLRKYLAGVADTEIVEANAKVNGDDTIDLLDLVRLRKYLAKDKVILE